MTTQTETTEIVATLRPGHSYLLIDLDSQEAIEGTLVDAGEGEVLTFKLTNVPTVKVSASYSDIGKPLLLIAVTCEPGEQ